MILNFFIYLFSFFLLLNALMVISAQNSIYSVIFLILTFTSASGILFLIECEFFALVFIIVYVGAIAVLFLFVVMMLDVKAFETNHNSLKYFSFSSFVIIVLLWKILSMIPLQFDHLYTDFFIQNEHQNWFNKIDCLNEIEILGQVLYTHFVFQFLIAGLILTLSVVASVTLTLNLSKKNSHNQVIEKQLARKQKNALHF